MVDDPRPALTPTRWDLYIAAFWWVYAAGAIIGVIVVTGLYYERVTGSHVVDWCMTTCAMIGALIIALWLVLAHRLQGHRHEMNSTKQRVADVETRQNFIEEVSETFEPVIRPPPPV